MKLGVRDIIVFPIFLLSLSSIQARAQYASHSGIDLTQMESSSVQSFIASDTTPIRGAVAIRGLTAFIGWFPGAVAGGYFAAHVLTPSPCGCDDPGLQEVLTGLAVGGALGAAFGASIPELGSHCSFGHRLGLGLLGAAAGAASGFLPKRDSWEVVAVPVFSMTGAALAEWSC